MLGEFGMGKINYDYYTQMKFDLVKMDIELVENMVNIFALPIFCSWIYNDENMKESMSRLIDIHNLNGKNLLDLISYVKKLDDNNDEFFYADLIEEFECVKTNMDLQDSYYNNMLEYIGFCDDITNSRKDIEEFDNIFCLKDDSIFDQVQVNDSVIKMIKRERKKG